MESMGSVKTVLQIWKDCPNAYVAEIVTDEDSTTRPKLSLLKAKMVAAGRMTEEECRYVTKKDGNLGTKKRIMVTSSRPPTHQETVRSHPLCQKL